MSPLLSLLLSFTRKTLFVLVALAAVAATACSSSPAAPSAGLNETVILKLGQSVRVSDARLTLKFDAVNGDNRCPGDALCITGGDAVVAITVTPFVGQAAAYELHTGGVGVARHGDYLISLEQLSPYPFSSRPFDPASYEASLRVSPAR